MLAPKTRGDCKTLIQLFICISHYILTASSWLRLISGVHLAARDEFQTADKLRIQAAKSVQRSAARTFNQNAAAAMMLVRGGLW